MPRPRDPAGRAVARAAASSAELAAPGLRVRRTFPHALLCATLGAAFLTGCASDSATAPTHPGSGRPDGVTPEGLSDVRSELADRRAESRDLMDSTLLGPRNDEGTDAESLDETTGGLLGVLGDMVGTTVDVLSLQAFGVW